MTRDNPSSKIELADNILFIQGPIGPFFKKLAQLCERNGSNTYKINFTLGEKIFFYGKNTLLYRQGIDEWANFLHKYLIKERIQQIFLLSDARPIHDIAIKIAKELKIEVIVFEQGYMRPNRITVERFGVNGNSNIFNNIQRIKDYANTSKKIEFNHSFYEKYVRSCIKLPIYITLYVNLMLLTKFINKKYYELTPYNLTNRNILKQYSQGFLIILKKIFMPLENLINCPKSKSNIKWVKNNSKNFFLLILQLPDDYQIQRDSNFNDMYEVINKVLLSFKGNTKKKMKLMIKHHPSDKIYNNYSAYIKKCCHELNIPTTRIKYICDIHLPTCLKHALGCVTVNSSVGFSSILHNTPLCCLGKAIYNIPGLIYQEDLDSFWNDAENFKIDRELFFRFKNYVDYETQITGPGFWGKFDKNRFNEIFNIQNH